MTDFTPGPWGNVECPVSVSAYDDEGQQVDTWVAIGNPDFTDGAVAIVVADLGCLETSPEFEANIALITAAPDMVEALKMIEAGHSCPSAVARNALVKAGASPDYPEILGGK